jgi:hypothetical protein
MVGADQQLFVAAARGQLVPAMLTDIVKCPDCAVAVVRDEDILIVDFQRQVIAGFTDLARMAGQQPVLVKYLVYDAPI